MIGRNIATEIRTGKPKEQAAAIAYRTARGDKLDAMLDSVAKLDARGEWNSVANAQREREGLGAKRASERAAEARDKERAERKRVRSLPEIPEKYSTENVQAFLKSLEPPTWAKKHLAKTIKGIGDAVSSMCDSVDRMKAACDADFKEMDHPRDNDGKFASGNGSSPSPISPQEAKESYEKGKVPEGWYTHGRSNVGRGSDDPLETGNVIQMTKSAETANSYARESGSVHYLAPNENTDVHDLVDDPEGFARIEKAFKRDFERGLLPKEFEEVFDQNDIGDDPDAAWEAIKDGFDPEDIVSSAGWYDTDVVSWLADNFPDAFFKLTTGAVALSPRNLQRHEVKSAIGDSAIGKISDSVKAMCDSVASMKAACDDRRVIGGVNNAMTATNIKVVKD